MDSDSIRPSACCKSGESFPPAFFVSSAYPRIAAKGVRSSCEASATNRRIFSSLSNRDLKASSTWSSIRFNAAPTCPTSLSSVAYFGGTLSPRRTSPLSSGCLVTADAVSRIRSNGLSAKRTSHAPIVAPKAITRLTTTIMMRLSRARALRMSLSGKPTTICAPSIWATGSARYSPRPSIRFTNTGLPRSQSMERKPPT